MQKHQGFLGRRTTRRILRDVLAASLWLYAIFKLTVFDFDVYLLQHYAPSLFWLINYKFVLLLVLISAYWLAVGNKSFFWTLFFLATYPFYLIFWRLGRLLFRNWFLTFSVVGYVASFLRSLKINFMTFTLFCLGTLLVIVGDRPLLIYLGMLLLGLYLILHFSRRFFYAFVPSRAIVLPRKALITFLAGTRQAVVLPADVRSTAVDLFTPQQKNQWETNLQLFVLQSRATIYAVSKLRQFQESRLISLYFILGLLFTLFITVVLFAVLNFGVQTMDPRAFSDASPRGLLFFLYYSLNNILTHSIPDFYPLSVLSRFLNTAEIVSGFLILVILVLMYTNVQSDKAKAEIDALIGTLEQQASEIEDFISKEFAVDLQQAVEVINKLPNSFIKLFYHLSSLRSKP